MAVADSLDVLHCVGPCAEKVITIQRVLHVSFKYLLLLLIRNNVFDD